MINLKITWVGFLLALGAAVALTNACNLSPQPEPPAEVPTFGSGSPGGSTGGGPVGSGGENAVTDSVDAGEVLTPPNGAQRDEDGGLPGDAAADAGH